ncbi:hypothetical protein AAEX28_15410 [Lentisphaerota bacterium WC36G]|nr:hypothetical protein LJT99_02170 [Lentisphaerae bacterium WC36]
MKKLLNIVFIVFVTFTSFASNEKIIKVTNGKIKFSIQTTGDENYYIKKANNYSESRKKTSKDFLTLFIYNRNNDKVMSISLDNLREKISSEKLENYIKVDRKKIYHSIIKQGLLQNKDFKGYYILGENKYSYNKRKTQGEKIEYTLDSMFNYGDYVVDVRCYLKNTSMSNKLIKMLESIKITKSETKTIKNKDSKLTNKLCFYGKNILKVQIKLRSIDKLKKIMVFDVLKNNKNVGNINVSSLDMMFLNKDFFLKYVKTIKNTMCQNSSKIKEIKYEKFNGFYFTGELKNIKVKQNTPKLWIIACCQNQLLIFTLSYDSNEDIDKYLNYFKTVNFKMSK